MHTHHKLLWGVSIADTPFLIHPTMALEPIHTGKKGGIITYYVGDTILAREYNPHPADPKTQKQVAQRAKIKLLSQIAALFRFIIAIFPTSEKSARSLFQALNWEWLFFDRGQAQIYLEDIDLTGTYTYITDISYHVRYVSGLPRAFIYFPDEPPDNINRVFYYLFKLLDNNRLELLDYICTENRGASPLYQYYAWRCDAIELDEQAHTTADYYVYAFGMIDKSIEATEKWDENTFEPVEHLAPQIKLGLVTAEDYEFTRTKAMHINRGI